MSGASERILKKAAWLSLLVLLTACASNPSRWAAFVPDHVKAVYVFSVLSPAEARELAEDLVRETERLLAQEQKVYPVENLALADALIEARIKRLFFDPLTRTLDGELDQARLCCELVFSFREKGSPERLIEHSELIAVRDVQLISTPISDLRRVKEELANDLAGWVVAWCMSGKPPRYDPLFGYEHLPDPGSEGILIGNQRPQRDLNNDGIDDKLQGLTNHSLGY